MIITKNIEVRYRDIDSMGHVNNAVYLNYFEQARMRYFFDLIGRNWDWQKDGMVVARQEIDYKLPVVLGDDVNIETWCEHVGNASLVFKYNVLVSREEKPLVAVQGKTILVCYDNVAQKVAAVPSLWREKITIVPAEQ